MDEATNHRGGRSSSGQWKIPREQAQQEIQIEMFGQSIREDACQGSPENINEYDSSYMTQGVFGF
jgi:hypothetical protein